jgi:RHS repeat-associated protein
VSTWYNWGLGWSVLNEESGTGSGALVKTYVGGMAEIAGSNPATGAYSYYMTDNLGSPRAVYDGSKALAAVFDYTPYGQAYAENDTVGITHRYTGHDWDATANLYFAPYRFYNPQLARWMSRDPLGMVDGPNVYKYVRGNPIRKRDPLGMREWPGPLGGSCCNRSDKIIHVLVGGEWVELKPGECNAGDCDGICCNGVFYPTKWNDEQYCKDDKCYDDDIIWDDEVPIPDPPIPPESRGGPGPCPADKKVGE